ncbi:LOW QUALITY PROTEIN: nucleosome assembly protein 1-like 3 [Ctenodactylus gundi]
MSQTNRVPALRNTQDECDKVDALFLKAVHDLERKAELSKTLCDKRFQIIRAEYEPREEECGWNSEDGVREGTPRETTPFRGKEEESSKEKAKDRAEEKKVSEEILEGKGKETAVPKDILEINSEEKVDPQIIWRRLLKKKKMIFFFLNVHKPGPTIEKYDKPIQKFLSDVSKCSEPGRPISYTFEIHFLPNPYFRSEQLVKTYIIKSKQGHNDPFSGRGETEDCKGCRINWRRGEDVTVTTTQSRTSTGEMEIKPRVLPNASFFCFFSPQDPEIELEPPDDAILDEDLEIGHILHDNVILKIPYYTGEVSGTYYQDFKDYTNRKYQK